MKIWIVQNCIEYEGCNTILVTASERRAKEEYEKLNRQHHPYYGECEEWEVEDWEECVSIEEES